MFRPKEEHNKHIDISTSIKYDEYLQTNLHYNVLKKTQSKSSQIPSLSTTFSLTQYPRMYRNVAVLTTFVASWITELVRRRFVLTTIDSVISDS